MSHEEALGVDDWLSSKDEPVCTWPGEYMADLCNSLARESKHNTLRQLLDECYELSLRAQYHAGNSEYDTVSLIMSNRAKKVRAAKEILKELINCD